MTKRYPHMLRLTKGDIMPTRVIVVDVHSDQRQDGDENPTTSDSLCGWHASCLTAAEGHLSVTRTASGSVARGFWDMLVQASDTPAPTWILSWQCGRVWTLLDLWGEIESKTITLIDREYRGQSVEDDDVQAARHTQADPLGRISPTALRRAQQRREGYLVIEDPPCVAKLKVCGCPGWIVWVDSRNYGVEMHAGKMTPRQRVSALGKWITDYVSMINTAGLGSLQVTAASQAHYSWRKLGGSRGVYCHNHKQALALEGESYNGGRCEAFRIGTADRQLYHLDYRSMYPSLCVSERVPVRLKSIQGTTPLGDMYTLPVDLAPIARVRIDTDEPDYPLRDGRDVIYPVGRFTTTLCGPELWDALRRQRVVQIDALALYHRAPALKDFSERMYTLRALAESENNEHLARSVKKMLVSIVGKLGQRDRRWVHCPRVWSDIQYGEWWGSGRDGKPCRYRAVAGHVQRDETLGWGADAVPAIAAWITSAGRMKLLSAIRAVGWYHVWYVDTDAIMTDAIGLDRLYSDGQIEPNRIGMLQIIHSPTVTEIRGVKYYVQDGRVVCSGLPRGVCVDAGDGLHYWHSDTPYESIRAGHKPSATGTFREYHRDSNYRHGNVQADGRVTPLYKEDW